MRLNVVRAGSGTPVVLLHGLTATHRYVVMGSKSLERSGHDVVAYDARGHGESEPGDRYDYGALAADLGRVMDEAGLERAVLAGASMGAHTALRYALDEPERVAGLVLITPAYDPATFGDTASLARWDALSEGLQRNGVEGFVDAYGDPGVPPEWRDKLMEVIRQRLSKHANPLGVAAALREVPRSAPFRDLGDLREIGCPTVVVGDRDEADPGHPLQIAETYARSIPGAELVVEREGQSPIAWQGSQLSKVIAGVAARSAPAPRR